MRIIVHQWRRNFSNNFLGGANVFFYPLEPTWTNGYAINCLDLRIYNAMVRYNRYVQFSGKSLRYVKRRGVMN